MTDPTESAAGFSRDELSAIIMVDKPRCTPQEVELATFCLRLMDERDCAEVDDAEACGKCAACRMTALWSMLRDERAAHDKTAEALESCRNALLTYESEADRWLRILPRFPLEDRNGPLLAQGGGDVALDKARTALAAWKESRATVGPPERKDES